MGCYQKKTVAHQLLSPSGKINLTVLFVANLDSPILQNNFEWGHMGLRVITEGLNDNIFSSRARGRSFYARC